MAFNEFIGNRGGIPLVAATQTTAGSATANAVFSMPNHTFRAMGVAGIMVINFSAATTTALVLKLWLIITLFLSWQVMEKLLLLLQQVFTL